MLKLNDYLAESKDRILYMIELVKHIGHLNYIFSKERQSNAAKPNDALKSTEMQRFNRQVVMRRRKIKQMRLKKFEERKFQN